jgi:hypothetical protein
MLIAAVQEMIADPNRIEPNLRRPCHSHVLRPSDQALDFRQLNTDAKRAHCQYPVGADTY